MKKVVVIAGQAPAKQEITGSFEKVTPGLYGGIGAGSAAGSPSMEIGGVTVGFPIPILTLPGAIVGGITGKTMRDIQEFRDALTEDLAQAESQPLTSEGFALDVYRGLQQVPGLDLNLFAPNTPVPGDTDATLHVSVKDVTIDVHRKEAILSTTAEVALRRLGVEKDIYKRVFQYQDRDTLENWTANENALWHDYANFARHYLAREITAEVFDRVELQHELQPKPSDTVARVKKNEWHGVSRSSSPTLAWDLTLRGGDSYGSWVSEIDESDIYYVVEIYDRHRLVYAQQQIPDSQHTLTYGLDPCQTYRWSVRPSYHVGDDIKFGEWMRFKSDSDTKTAKGSVGRKASAAPAYTQDFALLKIDCGRR